MAGTKTQYLKYHIYTSSNYNLSNKFYPVVLAKQHGSIIGKSTNVNLDVSSALIENIKLMPPILIFL